MNLVLAPMLLPFVGAIICLFFRENRAIQRVVSGAVSLALPVLAFYLLLRIRSEGVMAVRVGHWPDAYGIVFAVDLLGAIMLTIAGITQAATWWFLGAGGASPEAEKHLLYPLFLMMGAGVNWAFSTGDIFNLFVSFEIILLSSYILLSHGNEATQIRESLKYVVLNILASTLFLVTAGLTYGIFGSLNMADLAVRVSQAVELRPHAVVIGTMFMLTFAIKGALFPLFYWLPDAYPKAPPGISAYFAGMLTKVGVYCLYRVFTLIFRDVEFFTIWFQPLLLAIAGSTMIVGVLCALSQWTMRRILSFHIISQIGYMIFGLAIFTPLALAAGIFYIIHHIIVKASLFLVADSVKLNIGSEELKKTGGVIGLHPALAVCFLLAGLSLSGIPPLSGFYGKYGLVVEGFTEGHYTYVVISLLTSLFTLLSMMKIFRYVFWRSPSENNIVRGRKTGVIAATGGLVMVSVLIAIGSAWVMGLALETADQLLSREAYIHAVLDQRGVDTLRAAESFPETLP